MKSRSGFTVIEVLVVVAIIAILSGIATMAYINIQKETRDTVRANNASLIAAAFEKYYDTNNEYPSVARVVRDSPYNNSGIALANFFRTTKEIYLAPRAPSGITNSLSSVAPTLANDNFTYVASSATNNTNCQSSATGGCDQFDIQYRSEVSDTTITLKSRRRQ